MDRAIKGERLEARGQRLEVFVYESLTSGPLEDRFASAPSAQSLAREGAAMLRAIVADFARCENCEVAFLLAGGDSDFFSGLNARVEIYRNVPSRRAAFDRLAAAADWTLVIAPEINGELFAVARRVEHVGGRLLGPSPAFIAMASDKHRTAEHLRDRGIPAPRGQVFQPGELPRDVETPAVVKPLDGAGSLGVMLLQNQQDVSTAFANPGSPLRIESLQAGQPASVAVLCSPQGDFWPLPACEQKLSTDGRFSYLGGRAPIASDLNQRAQSLAVAAIQTFPAALGYVGLDLVLGDAPTATNDVLIEINPRLTTSYIGLRQLADCNLATAILQVAAGNEPTLRFNTFQIEF